MIGLKSLRSFYHNTTAVAREASVPHRPPPQVCTIVERCADRDQSCLGQKREVQVTLAATGRKRAESKVLLLAEECASATTATPFVLVGLRDVDLVLTHALAERRRSCTRLLNPSASADPILKVKHEGVVIRVDGNRGPCGIRSRSRTRRLPHIATVACATTSPSRRVRERRRGETSSCSFRLVELPPRRYVRRREFVEGGGMRRSA